jgi:acyl-coenzyme A synthetase/AMP-(fatty) acid ligase
MQSAMSSFAQLRSPAGGRHALFGHTDPAATAAWRAGKRVSAAELLGDVLRTADALPDARHMLNLHADRYRFAVAFLAAALRGQLTLLPPSTMPAALRSIRDFAPDIYMVGEAHPEVGMPMVELPEPGGPATQWEVPTIEGAQTVACLFTSGTTGEPRPNPKRWGSLVLDMLGSASRFGIGPAHTILGTVPPQHMYGFESTLLLPLFAGAALTPERLYHAADIDEALARAPAPRVLFTTPFHLRTWLESGDPPAIETIVSATAPLSVGLARQAEERTGARLFEIYGCTETGQVATRRPTQGAEWDPTEGVRIWNEGTQAMAAGGHVEEPTPLQDIIEVAADGVRFLLHGRTSDMVNIAGKRNSLGYLNHQLTSIVGVTDGVFFQPDDDGSGAPTRLTAFAVAPGLTAAAILEELRGRIDPAFLPRPLVLMESLPRALTGKLPREALAKLAAAARERPRGGS